MARPYGDDEERRRQLLAGYRCLVAHTRTGAIIDELPLHDFRWQESLDWARPGDMTISVKLIGERQGGDATLRARVKAVASGHWHTSLILMRGTTALFAGPVVSHSTSQRVVTFPCVSPAKLLDARVLIATGYESTPNLADADVSIDRDARGTVAQLLSLATTGPARELPLTVPAVPVVEDVARLFSSIDLAPVGDRIGDIVAEDNGPDLLIRPAVDTGATQLTWTALLGDPDLGVAVGSPWVWDYGTNAVEIEEDSDSSARRSTHYELGDGTERDRLISVAQTRRYTDDGFPALERVSRDTTSISDKMLLDAQAAAAAAAHAGPALAWNVDVDPEVWPHIGDWSFGDAAMVDVRGHWWIEDGAYLVRLLGVTHSPGKAQLGVALQTEA